MLLSSQLNGAMTTMARIVRSTVPRLMRPSLPDASATCTFAKDDTTKRGRYSTNSLLARA